VRFAGNHCVIRLINTDARLLAKILQRVFALAPNKGAGSRARY
jgi:hypothetical protein